MFPTTKLVCATQTERGLEVEVDNMFNGHSKMTLNTTLPEFLKGFALWKEEHLPIEKAFPKLSKQEREFLFSGEQQNELFEPRSLTNMFFGNGDIVPGIGG
jgi:hypothetical protein